MSLFIRWGDKGAKKEFKRGKTSVGWGVGSKTNANFPLLPNIDNICYIIPRITRYKDYRDISCLITVNIFDKLQKTVVYTSVHSRARYYFK